jgi:hypothetical protein
VKLSFIASCLLLVFGAGASADAQARPGKVEFSDGATLAGNISPTPGGELKIQAGKDIRVLALDQVREIRLTPEHEEMQRKWRFREAGQTAKEFFGDPYPVRSLQTTVTLSDGATLSGHLYTTVLYVEGEDGTRKVILPAKQTGNEGDSFKSLVFPARISFADATAPGEATVTLRVNWPGLAAGTQIAALTRGELVRLEATRGGATGEFKMPSPLGHEVFLALKTGGRIVVGWPASPDAKALAQVRQAMANSEDFFDQRRVFGAVRDPAGADIYSLVFAVRKGKTTLEETRSQPWRLEILRWKTEEGSERLMLAGQGYLFRGIGAASEAVPAVELSDKLWRIRKDGGVWSVGE